MVRVAVCDDEEDILKEMSGYLEELKATAGEGMKYSCFRQGEEIIREMEKGHQYHIVFLDIELKGENGIELAGQIRDRYPGTVIIFITGHDQYVYESFRVQPLDFLRKPLERKSVEEAFARGIMQCDVVPVWEYTFKDCFYKVLLSEICYFISDRRKVVVRTRTGEHVFYGKMDEVEEKLAQRSVNFVRINKYLIINMRYVIRMNYREVKLESGSDSWEFNISQPYRERVRKYCLDRWGR